MPSTYGVPALAVAAPWTSQAASARTRTRAQMRRRLDRRRSTLPKMLNGGAKVLDREDQVQGMRRRAFKPKLCIPVSGAIVDRVHEQGTDPVGSPAWSTRVIASSSQPAPEMPTLMAAG